MEVYSIDEAFLDLQGSREDVLEQAREIKKTVFQWVDVPVSVGIGPKKTLAEIAGYYSKRALEGVYFPKPSELDDHLRKIDVRDVWEIGSQYAKMLHSYDIHSAWDLKQTNESWIKKKMTLAGLKTLWELKGKPTFSFDEQPAPKKGIMFSRSCGKPVTTRKEIIEAGADYTSRAAQKLRNQNSTCKVIITSIYPNFFNDEEKQYNRSVHFESFYPLRYIPDIVKVVNRQLGELYKTGFRYKKISVYLTEIEQAGKIQLDLFHQEDTKRESVMKAVEKINRKYVREAIHCRAKQSRITANGR